MSHHIGRFEWITNPIHVKKLVPVTPERTFELDTFISRLPTILGNYETWLLSGGLAISLHKNEYYRDHLDIDIGLHQADLEAVVHSAEQNGYALATRAIMSKIGAGKKIDVYEKITPEEAIALKKKNLRLVKVEDKTKDILTHEDLLSYFDLYIHKNVGMDMVSNEGLIVPSSYNFGGIHYTHFNAGPIRLRSLQYLEALKTNPKNEVDKLDLKVIRELLERK